MATSDYRYRINDDDDDDDDLQTRICNVHNKPIHTAQAMPGPGFKINSDQIGQARPKNGRVWPNDLR